MVGLILNYTEVGFMVGIEILDASIKIQHPNVLEHEVA